MNYCRFRNDFIKRMANAGGGGLPAEYQQVEYLQSSGQQYLNIGAIANHQYIDIDFAYVNWVNNRYAQYNFNGLIGCNNIYVGGARVDTKLNFAQTPSIGGSVHNTGVTRINITANTKYNIYLSPSIYKFDGQTIDNLTAGDIVGSFNCYVFACYAPTDAASATSSAARVYRLKTSSVEMYPCYRKSDIKPGFYDVANDSFYTNAGTGEFIVGNNV